MNEATMQAYTPIPLSRSKCLIELDGRQSVEYQLAVAGAELAWKESRPSLGALWFVWTDKGPAREETSDTSILHNEHHVIRWSPDVD